ncbi:hypothetical protein J6590_037837 [Homalodisca vitripennis]|nr:hypothetical protein J6590_037837 [Homalodisca vitripennis]
MSFSRFRAGIQLNRQIGTQKCLWHLQLGFANAQPYMRLTLQIPQESSLSIVGVGGFLRVKGSCWPRYNGLLPLPALTEEAGTELDFPSSKIICNESWHEAPTSNPTNQNILLLRKQRKILFRTKCNFSASCPKKIKHPGTVKKKLFSITKGMIGRGGAEGGNPEEGEMQLCSPDTRFPSPWIRTVSIDKLLI